RRRDYRRDRFADKAHDLVREDRLLDWSIIVFVQHRLDRPRGQIGGANERDAIGRANPDNASGGDRAADETYGMSGGAVRGGDGSPAPQRPGLRGAGPAGPPLSSRARGRG